MTWIRRGSPRIALALGLLTAAFFASSARATTWTEIPSNTGEDITAIEYQGPDRFWFGTGAGRVFKRVGSAFQEKRFVPGAVIKDIEFQDGGNIGFAVGTNGTVLRSTDAGETWTQVDGIAGGNATSPFGCSDLQPIGDVDSVRFAGSARAWLFAGGNQIFRTPDVATAANVGARGTWEWINRGTPGACRITADIDDAFPIPGSSAIYFVGKSFGQVFFSSNALTSDASPKPGSAGNGFETTRRLVGDPSNSNRMWSVAPNGIGGSYYARTTDGWNSAVDWTVGGADGTTSSLTRGESIDFNGGTVLAAGTAGMIVTSIDGATFWFNPAGGAVATQDWKAVSLASANDAAVGGTSGKLLLTSDAANVIPAAPPAPPAGGGGTTPPPTTPRPPAIRFPSAANPPVTGGVARRGRRFVTVPVSGRLTPPRGISAAAACRGRVIRLRLSKTRGRRRTLLRTTVRVSRACRYRKQLRVRTSKLRGVRALLLQVSFRGNSLVGAARATYTIPVA
ncbi:MAG TPA: hypothetical protein VKB03_04570 [Conexibacter sp.]|nr:hypothetical protein [Conexibacter sp.]